MPSWTCCVIFFATVLYSTEAIDLYPYKYDDLENAFIVDCMMQSDVRIDVIDRNGTVMKSMDHTYVENKAVFCKINGGNRTCDDHSSFHNTTSLPFPVFHGSEMSAVHRVNCTEILDPPGNHDPERRSVTPVFPLIPVKAYFIAPKNDSEPNYVVEDIRGSVLPELVPTYYNQVKCRFYLDTVSTFRFGTLWIGHFVDDGGKPWDSATSTGTQRLESLCVEEISPSPLESPRDNDEGRKAISKRRSGCLIHHLRIDGERIGQMSYRIPQDEPHVIQKRNTFCAHSFILLEINYFIDEASDLNKGNDDHKVNNNTHTNDIFKETERSLHDTILYYFYIFVFVACLVSALLLFGGVMYMHRSGV